MKDALSLSGNTPLTEDLVLPGYLNCVLESRCFEKTPALRALLVFLWQHRSEQISEYAIATEALGRSSLFNAKTDATVRVQISRLRQRLEKFYEGEGQKCTERLIVPLGSHQIDTQLVVLDEPDIESAFAFPKSSHLIGILTTACGILLILCAALAVQVFRPQIGMQRAAPPPALRFWKSFYGNGLATRLILPTPVFFSYSYGPSNASGTLMVRDTNLNDYGGAQNSVPVRMLSRVFGGPSLAQSYTVSSDTFAAIKLMRYLDVFRLPTSVHSSAESVLESLDSENLIATGTWGTLTPLTPYLNRMSFKLANHEESVEIRNPVPGEPKRISSINEAKDRFICPGIIAVLPSQNRHTHVLILASRYTSALVSFLTCTDGLDQLEQMWRAKGRPEFYEVIVNAEMNGNTTIVRFWPVVLHALDSHS